MTAFMTPSSATPPEPEHRPADSLSRCPVHRHQYDGAAAATVDDAHAPGLAHHFESLGQQFSSAKLGMWIFLATELLLFGGLFCYYAVLRGNHPEVFAYGSQFLDTWLGATNTVVLIVSSMTMAMAVSFAQRGQRRPLVWCLAATLLGGGVFMGIKYVEYSHKIHDGLVWGRGFYAPPHVEPPAPSASEVEGDQAAPPPPPPPQFSAKTGESLWMATCRSCHGVAGEGIVGQGKDIRGSEFIASQSDEELVKFIKGGRMPFDKLNTTGLQMPPRGGNPTLKDDDLRHIVAYIRTFKAPEPVAPSEPDAPTEGAAEGAEAEPSAPPAGATAGEATASGAASSSAQSTEFYIPKSSIPNAAQGPRGISPRFRAQRVQPLIQPVAHHTEDPTRPANAHLYFNIYFLTTGLHGIHVLVGMLVIGWLLIGAVRGRYGPHRFTQVDLGGLYWHLVDLIWIFLFPLLYLI